MSRLLRLLLAALAAAFAIAACSDSSPTPGQAPSVAISPSSSAADSPAASASSPAAFVITIKDFAFGAPLTVPPGATITVVNDDDADHDATSDDGLFRTPTLAKGERASFTAPTRAGTYKYSCTLHLSSMSGTGTLIVQG